MSAELALLDSNVLVYAYYEESQHHAAALGLLNQAQDGLIALCLFDRSHFERFEELEVLTPQPVA